MFFFFLDECMFNLRCQFRFQGNLECYYDASSRVMYLHLTSHYDINVLSQKCQELGKSAQANVREEIYICHIGANLSLCKKNTINYFQCNLLECCQANKAFVMNNLHHYFILL